MNQEMKKIEEPEVIIIKKEKEIDRIKIGRASCRERV